MVTELPLDIWIDIVNGPLISPVLQRDSIRNLSLTSTNLRAVAVPVLYQSLEFNLNHHYVSQNATLVKVLRHYVRAAGLHSAPHLLRHVRKLYLRSWPTYLERALGVVSPLGHLKGRAADSVESAIYDCVIKLIHRMPALQHVKIQHCLMTDRLHYSLCTHSRLDSLDLVGLDLDTWRGPKEPYSHRNIRCVRYQTGRHNRIDGYFPMIMTHCSAEIRTLAIRCTELTFTVSWASNQPLSLHTLHITSMLPEYASKMGGLLRLCPELRVLTVYGEPKDYSEVHVTADTAPELHTISGPLEFASALTIGRPVQRLTVTQIIDPRNLMINDIVGHSTTHLQELVLHLHVSSYQGLLKFLPSLQIYQSLKFLQILLYSPHWSGGPTISPRDLNNGIGDALRTLVSLQVFDIRGELLNPIDMYTPLFLCPFGSEYDPNNRGHPSLEMFRAECLGAEWWVWVTEKGWCRRSPSYPSPHIGYYFEY